MNVILNTPISVSLTSGLLMSEGDGIGTLQFTISGQPVSLALASSLYTYDTPFAVNDRVKIILAFGSLGLNSEGTLQKIIVDPFQDKADVLFDIIYPNQTFKNDETIDVTAGDVSVLVTVPLENIQKI